MNLNDGDEGRVEVVRLRFFSVEHFDRIRSTGNGEDGTAEEVF